jgi:two-component system nitrate/nitrite response regulator NarL
MKTPLIITHPSTLLHGGLRHALTKSLFGPLFIAPTLSEELESQMQSFGTCIWLIGVGRYDSIIGDLLRRVKTAAPGAKPVILAAYHTSDDIAAARRAGACGFLHEGISAEQLLKSLELIGCGQAVVHRDCHMDQLASGTAVANDGTQAQGEIQTKDIDRIGASPSGQTPENDHVKGLSRRELLILRMLTEGASNKVIALKLVITESTVKVHMKAILRKLRLENRTQAAMWARNHIDQAIWAGLSRLSHNAGRSDGTNASLAFTC